MINTAIFGKKIVSPNLIKFREKVSDSDVNSKGVYARTGYALYVFSIDGVGEKYINVGKTIKHVYGLYLTPHYFNGYPLTASTYISTGDPVYQIGNGTIPNGVKINVPTGCEYVVFSASPQSQISDYMIGDMPMIVVSDRYIAWEPYDKYQMIDIDALVLAGKRVYWIGDSIMFGLYCTSPISQKIDDMFETYSINKAVSGNQIYGGQIASQLANLPNVEPDVIVFNGGCNDSGKVYGDGTNSNWALHPGNLETALNTAPSMTGTYPTSTCVDSFENLAQTMKKKYPNAKIIYVVTHYCAVSARTYADQKGTLDAYSSLAKKWGMSVVDMREDINAIIDNSFTDGGNGSPDGTHPNDNAHYKFFIPKIRAKLIELAP